MKKSIIYFLVLFVVSVTLVSCETEQDTVLEVENQQVEKLDLSNLKFDLKIDFGFAKRHLIKEGLESFIMKNYEDITSIDQGLMVVFETGEAGDFFQIFNLNSLDDKSKLNTSCEIFQTNFKKSCKKCRSRECVRGFISEAIGDGTTTVYISVTPNYTLGIQTSVTICKSNKAFVEN